MHGQKKRRKRTIAGRLDLDGIALDWRLKPDKIKYDPAFPLALSPP
jgi:hypothetical protein